MGEALADIWALAKQTIESVNQETDTVTRLASATPFLDAFGHVVIAWLWLRQALVAQKALQKARKAMPIFMKARSPLVSSFIVITYRRRPRNFVMSRLRTGRCSTPRRVGLLVSEKRGSSQRYARILLKIRSDSA